MSFLDATLLGIVEGVTEFLPISSTGHLILAGELLNLPVTEFSKTFDLAIQSGAMLAVVVLYWRSFLRWKVLTRIAAAFVPTAVIGLLAYRFVKDHLLGNAEVVLWALFVGGILLIVFELLHKEKELGAEDTTSMTYLQSVLVGVAQSIAIIPGVSRSGATILGGLLLGVKRIAIVEFSFLLAVPTIGAATLYDLYKSTPSFAPGDLELLAVGTLVSFVVALLAIKFLLSYIRYHTFIAFGAYRIALALLFWLVLL